MSSSYRHFVASILSLVSAVSSLNAQTRTILSNPACGTAVGNISTDTATFHDKSADFLLYSMADFRTMDLSRGKFVGIIERKAGNTGASTVFPTVTQGAIGCLLMFLSVPVGEQRAYPLGALLLSSNDTITVQMGGVALCRHKAFAHHVKAPPAVVIDPKDCGKDAEIFLSTTVRINATTTVTTNEYTLSRGGTFTEEVKRLVADTTRQHQFSKAHHSMLKKLYDPGPWFPCEAAGCCRVF